MLHKNDVLGRDGIKLLMNVPFDISSIHEKSDEATIVFFGQFSPLSNFRAAP